MREEPDHFYSVEYIWIRKCASKEPLPNTSAVHSSPPQGEGVWVTRQAQSGQGGACKNSPFLPPCLPLLRGFQHSLHLLDILQFGGDREAKVGKIFVRTCYPPNPNITIPAAIILSLLPQILSLLPQISCPPAATPNIIPPAATNFAYFS